MRNRGANFVAARLCGGATKVRGRFLCPALRCGRLAALLRWRELLSSLKPKSFSSALVNMPCMNAVWINFWYAGTRTLMHPTACFVGYPQVAEPKSSSGTCTRCLSSRYRGNGRSRVLMVARSLVPRLTDMNEAMERIHGAGRDYLKTFGKTIGNGSGLSNAALRLFLKRSGIRRMR